MVAPESQWPILRRYYKLPYKPPRFWIRLVSRLVISFKSLSKSNATKVEPRGRKWSRQSSYWSTTSEESQVTTPQSGSQPSLDDFSLQNYGSSFTPLPLTSYTSMHDDDEALEIPETVLTDEFGYSHTESLRLTESWQTAYFMDKSNRYWNMKPTFRFSPF